jgi:stage V sporulation protein G
MQITEVKITLKDEEKLKAYASVTFDNAFVVRGMKVINGTTGFFVSMPSRKKSDGTYQDIAHPINIETREMIETVILQKYKEALEQRPAAAPGPTGTGPTAPAAGGTVTAEEL